MTAAVPPLHEGLITCMYTDVEGSTTISKNTLPDAYQRVMAEHDQRLKQYIAENDGQVVGEPQGDAFLATFAMPHQALACAKAIQTSLRDHPIVAKDKSKPDKTYTFTVRIGLFRARKDVTFNKATGQYNDSEVNLASRVLKLTEGGQILVHSGAYETTTGREQYDWAHFPGQRLKDFDTPEDLHELLWYPGQVARDPGRRFIPQDFRVSFNTYIERKDKQDDIIPCLKGVRKAGHLARIITLKGYGGMGKTRLAVECALRVASLFEDGVFFVALDTLVPSAPAVAEAIAVALGITQPFATQKKRVNFLLGQLRDKHLLLVLDNYENVACEKVQGLLRQLHNGTDRLLLLVTGREAVKIDDAETVREVGGLDTKKGEELFIARAQLKANRHDWQPDDNERPLLQKIVGELTDGIALAIELAAAQMDNFTLLEIVEGLEKTPLIGHQKGHAHADPSERHISLTRSLNWSFRLLTAEQQQGFARLGLFADSFTVETARDACGIADAQDLLTRLNEAALVNRSEVNGRSRYAFLRPTREYAREEFKPLSDAEHETVRARYVAYYVQLAYANNNINDDGKRAILDAEWHNAVDAAYVAKQSEEWEAICTLSERMGDFLLLRGLWSERETLNLLALQVARAAEQLAGEGRALNNLGIVYYSQGRWQEALACYEQDLAICRQLGDKQGEGATLMNLGIVYQSQGRWQEAIACFEQSLPLFRQLGDKQGEGQTLMNLGIVYYSQGRWQEALACYEQSLAICRQLGDKQGEGQTLNNLGNVYQSQGRWQEAIACFEQSLLIKRQLGDKQGEGQTLWNMAVLHEKQNDIPGALAWGRRALAVLEQTEDRRLTETVRGWVAEWEAGS